MIVMMIVLFLVLLLLGTPIVAAMGIPGLLYFILEGIPISTMSYSAFQMLNSFTLVAIPMYILMGIMINNFGGTDRIFNFTRILLRNQRGYSAKLNVIISLIFSGVSGAAIADIGGLGKMQIKAMENEGYSRAYASALTVTTATIGPIFPPSIPLIIFALTAQVSAVKALVAGAVPALLITILLYVYVIFYDRYKFKDAKNIQPLPAIQKGELWKSFKESFPFIMAAPFIIVGMLFGIFSPSEAGVIGVLFLLIVGLIQKEVTWKRLYDSLKETFISMTSILLVVTAGSIFTKALVMERLPEIVTTSLLNYSSNPIVILLLINIVLLIIGLFMESISALILVVPILLSVGTSIGLDPIHLGVIIVLNLMIGMATPPFGMSLYTVAKVADISPMKVLKDLVPQYIPLLGALIVVTFWPDLSLWLPNLMFK